MRRQTAITEFVTFGGYIAAHLVACSYVNQLSAASMEALLQTWKV